MRKKIIKIIIILIISFVNYGCSNKEVISANAFSAILKNHDFEIIDLTEQYNDIIDVNKLLIGKSTNDYQIEYWVLQDEKIATKIFNDNVNNITSSYNVKVIKREGNNYLKDIFNLNNLYIVITRVENTIIFVKSSINNQEEVDKLLSEMNY